MSEKNSQILGKKFQCQIKNSKISIGKKLTVKRKFLNI